MVWKYITVCWILTSSSGRYEKRESDYQDIVYAMRGNYTIGG
jgi:hypothetical protein